ncbi:MAG: DUF2130 domain-containing protein [Acholeplasmatales bacterium]|nr:DUF2130 domain-containing protein [Acholeplasmatales bacterium]
MKELKVIVKDKNTLVLDESGEKGDYIDLSSLSSVDTQAILQSIDEAKDKVYQSKLEEYKKSLVAESKLDIEKLESKYNNEINNLKSELNKLTELNEEKIKAKDKEKTDALKIKESEIEKKYLDIINELNNKLSTFEANKNTEISNINNKHNEEIQLKKNEYDILKTKYDSDIKNKELELQNKYDKQINYLKSKAEIIELKNKTELDKLNYEHQKQLDDSKYDYEIKIKDLEERVLGLQRQRNNLTSKLIGEDLETWCTNEAISYMQVGLFNCTWTKDNEVIQNADEVKGTKGDFIFNIYATNEHNPDELLANMLLEMKNESSSGKKKNSDYYEALDKNRNKKKCKYAILVSDLGRESNNDLPMFKVSEYTDMYVVRPEYMMTFINIISSVTVKFVDLVLAKTKEELNLKNKKEILEEFDSIKKTYLENPLKLLSDSILEIEKQTDSIMNCASKINIQIEKIKVSYISQIEKKLETYTPKLNRLLKKTEE